MTDGYRIAREITDAVFGEGTYAHMHRDSPDPGRRREARMTDDRTEAEKIDPSIHIDQDDPRYDGFRIHEYWMLTATGPDNQEAPLYVNRAVAVQYHLAEGPAMAADPRRLEHLRDYARAMIKVFGKEAGELKIRHFVPDGRDEIFTEPLRGNNAQDDIATD